jgi:hypothetical protein
VSDERPSAYTLLWRARDILLDSPAWIDYARNVYAIDPGDHPFLTYVGINFTKDRIKNYKFYFSFYRRLSAAELDILLPVPDRGRFDELYAEHWHPTQRYSQLHRGTTFAIKVEPDGKLTHYYHLRLRGLPFGPPSRLEIKDSDRDNYHGVCEEFRGSTVSLKRYFYLRHPETIAESLAIAGMPDRTGEVEMLEYIESDDRDKLCWITGDPILVETLLYERGQKRLASGLVKICNDCRFSMYAPGSARDGSDHSIYFNDTTGPIGGPAGYLFDGVRTFAVRYLKLDRFPRVD